MAQINIQIVQYFKREATLSHENCCILTVDLADVHLQRVLIVYIYEPGNAQTEATVNLWS